MGYYVTLESSNARIPQGALDEAYRLLCDLNNDNSLKNGGNGLSFDKAWREANQFGANENVWFSWMHWNYPEVCTNTGDILHEVGFEFSLGSDGLLFQCYDNKTGCEDVFLAALAPVLASTDDEAPFFLWRGEDGAVWRQILVDGELVSQVGRIAFEPV